MTNENVQDNNEQIEQSTVQQTNDNNTLDNTQDTAVIENVATEEVVAEEVKVVAAEEVVAAEVKEEIAEVEKVVETEPKVYFEPPVNTEALEKQKEEFSNLEKQVLEIANIIDENTDFRSVRKNIVTLKEQILSLFLIPIVDKDKLTNTLQETYEKLAEKQNEIKDEMNKVFDENLTKFTALVDEKIKEASELDLFKNARKILQDVQKQLKPAKIRQGDKDEFFRKIQEVFDDINKKEATERESYEMECSDNYLVVKPKVEQITKLVDKSERFNDARKKLIELQNEIKDIKLKRNNRDELFQIIRESFNLLNERQDKHRDVFTTESKENYEKIVPLVEQAIEFAKNPSNFTTARQTLINIQKDLKELALTKSQRDELFGKVRECFTGLNEMQDENRGEYEEESNQNYAKLEIKVQEALMNVEYSSDFRDIREGLLTVQDEIKIMKLKRSHRIELSNKIRTGFEKFDEKRNEYNKHKNEEKKRKLNSILENLNLKVKRVKESLVADKNSLNEYTQKVVDASDEDKANFENSIKDITNKITDKESSLENSNKRINDITEELNKL